MDASTIDYKIKQLYKDYDGWKISTESINKMPYFHRSMRYDEASTESFLKALSIVGSQPDEIFIDLGSGLGKKVIAASLYGNFSKCTGIEYLAGLHEVSNTIKINLEKELNQHTSIEFIHSDYYDIDFSYASVIHISISPIMISFQLYGTLGEKLKKLRKGARIIISEVQIPLTEFKLIETVDYNYIDVNSKAFIYEKII